MVTKNIAEFINLCYLAYVKQFSGSGFELADGTTFYQKIDFNGWFVYGLNILIGILILTNYKRISRIFMKKDLGPRRM